MNELLNIGIAVKDIDAAVIRLQDAFGWKLEGTTSDHPDLGVRTAFLNVGPFSIELITPLAETGPLHRFLESRGEGLYRLAFSTQELDHDLIRLREHAVDYFDITAATGSSTSGRVVMTHPKHAHGVMLELIEQI